MGESIVRLEEGLRGCNDFFLHLHLGYGVFLSPPRNLRAHRSKGFIHPLKWTSALFATILNPGNSSWIFPWKSPPFSLLIHVSYMELTFLPASSSSGLSMRLGSGPSVDQRPQPELSIHGCTITQVTVSEGQQNMNLEGWKPDAVGHHLATT